MHRVRVIFNGISGAPWLATHYFGSTDPLQTAQEAVTAVGNFWGTVDLQMSTLVSWTTEAEVAEIDIETGDLTGVTTTTPVVGTGSSAASLLPPATQCLIRWRTGTFVEGREIRGRTFVPGLTISASVNGRPASGVVTALNAAAATLVADVTADLYVWSRPRPEPEPRVGLIGNVTSGGTWTEFASLRSRRD